MKNKSIRTFLTLILALQSISLCAGGDEEKGFLWKMRHPKQAIHNWYNKRHNQKHPQVAQGGTLQTLIPEGSQSQNTPVVTPNNTNSLSASVATARSEEMIDEESRKTLAAPVSPVSPVLLAPQQDPFPPTYLHVPVPQILPSPASSNSEDSSDDEENLGARPLIPTSRHVIQNPVQAPQVAKPSLRDRARKVRRNVTNLFRRKPNNEVRASKDSLIDESPADSSPGNDSFPVSPDANRPQSALAVADNGADSSAGGLRYPIVTHHVAPYTGQPYQPSDNGHSQQPAAPVVVSQAPVQPVQNAAAVNNGAQVNIPANQKQAAGANGEQANVSAEPKAQETNWLDDICNTIMRNPIRTGLGVAGGIAGSVGLGYLLWHLCHGNDKDKNTALKPMDVTEKIKAIEINEQRLQKIADAIAANNTKKARQLMNDYFPRGGDHPLRRDLRDGLSKRIEEMIVAEKNLNHAPGNARFQRAQQDAIASALHCIKTQCAPQLRAEKTRIKARARQAHAAAVKRQQRELANQKQIPAVNPQAAAALGAEKEPGIFSFLSQLFDHPIMIGLALTAVTSIVQRIRGGFPFNLDQAQQAPPAQQQQAPPAPPAQQ